VFNLIPTMSSDKWESFWETLTKEETLVVKSKGKTKNGKVFPTEVKAHYLEFEGKEFVCSFISDIRIRIKEQKKRKRLATEKEHFESELKIATLVQNDFLPEKPPERFDIDFAAKTIPAKFVGGDFYDFIPLVSDLLALVLGNVSGRGVSTALYMARLLSDFRHVAPMTLTPAQALTEVNKILTERSRRGMFATTLLLFLGLETKLLTASNAGHQPLIIKKKDQVAVNLGNANGAPIGILPSVDYQQDEIQLQCGDLVFAYTDRASEAMNADGEPFGVSRIRDRIADFSGSTQELVDQIEKDIIESVGDKPAHDDLTFIAFQIK
jgi:phosphoserine phosphatase RsbU/P